MSKIVNSKLKDVVFVAAAMALPAIAAAAWTPLGAVTQVYSHSEYQFVQTDLAEDACGTAGKFYWLASDPDADAMLAVALAALTAEKKYRVSGNFTTPTCKYGGARIDNSMISRDPA